jgi:hypothetical protein|tara:strand:- start:161 stop:646 length:486 start_codon:yes stop_codon:yes gene_type:complete
MNYDNTKRMLNTLRRLNESVGSETTKLINEQEEEKELKDTITVVDGVEVRIIASSEEDLELQNDSKSAISQVIENFKTQVSDLGDLRPGLTIQKDQIRLDGVLPDVDLNFVIVAGTEKGVYLNTSMLKLTYDLIGSIEKLIKFEDVFADGMNDLITQRRID